MRLVKWTDADGWKHQAYIRDNDTDADAPSVGIRCDPPDLSEIDWREVAKELNNELLDRGIATQEDVIRVQNGVSNTVRRVVTMKILQLYRMEVQE